MKQLFYILLFAICFIGCKKTEVTEFTDSPIIESYLKPGDFVNVKISRQIPFSSNVQYSSDDINNLNLTVTKNNIVHTLTSLGEGNYIDSSLVAVAGDQYKIEFTFNKKNVSAYTNIPSKPINFEQSATEISISRMDSSSGPPTSMTMPDPISLTWTNSDGSYYLVVIENIESTLDPIRDFGNKEPPGNRFRKQPVNSSGLELNPMEFQYFGTHRIILFHVLPDYAALYDETSSSSQNLTNPSTSIFNGYGIFTGLNSDTLYLEVTEQ